MDPIGRRPRQGFDPRLGAIPFVFADGRFAARAGEAIGMNAGPALAGAGVAPTPEALGRTSAIEKRSGANR
jgi:hypothetical protein